MSVTLMESYRHCQRIARRTGKNFYWSFLVMPAEKRRAMCAIYAFMRRSDDIADGAANPAIALEALRQWRRQVESAFRRSSILLDPGDANEDKPDACPADLILPALADTVKRYRIEARYFRELLDGAEMDQTKTRYETFEELYRYCYHVASVVGLIVLPIFGYRDKAALAPAEACGIAFQLTNILRDVKEDARLGRIYLPREDLKRFGVEEADIMNSHATPEFLALMKFEAERARQYYERARPLLELIEPDSRGTLAVMMAIYGGILDKIEAKHYAVFDERVRLSTAEKLWIVLKHWRRP